MLNLFDDVNKKEVGLTKFNENIKQERSEHTNLSEEHEKSSHRVKGRQGHGNVRAAWDKYG